MENKELQEDTIDLKKLANIIIEHRKKVATIIAGFTMSAIVISFVLPKQYESTTLVQTRSSEKDLSVSAAFSSVMGGESGSPVNVMNYMELMKSRRVLEPIINDMDWEDEKKKPTAAEFAKKYLTIQNTKQTNLITVTAKGKTPEEAQKISQEVVDNFLLLQTDMNQQTQSLLVNFLEKRIEEARTDAEEARSKFAKYQQEHRIFSPDEQAKTAVAKMKAFDEAISNMQVQERANQAKLDAVNDKLGDIGSKSKKYNINDNEIVMNLRKQIVDAQIELVRMQESYTEEHPNVISLKEKINVLQKKLSNEVETIVASKYTTINTTQAGLITEQANAEVSVAVAQASEMAIKQRQTEEEKKLDNFPKEALEYMTLQREANIKDQVYTSLIQQSEDKKIKETMESLDIQVVDRANLPEIDKPAAPRKKIVAAIGFIIGVFISLGYSFFLYGKK